MSDKTQITDKLHRMEDDLDEYWLEDWAEEGIAEIEEFLAPYAAFLDFLQNKEGQAEPSLAVEDLMDDDPEISALIEELLRGDRRSVTCRRLA